MFLSFIPLTFQHQRNLHKSKTVPLLETLSRSLIISGKRILIQKSQESRTKSSVLLLLLLALLHFSSPQILHTAAAMLSFYFFH